MTWKPLQKKESDYYIIPIYYLKPNLKVFRLFGDFYCSGHNTFYGKQILIYHKYFLRKLSSMASSRFRKYPKDSNQYHLMSHEQQPPLNYQPTNIPQGSPRPPNIMTAQQGSAVINQYSLNSEGEFYKDKTPHKPLYDYPN